MRHLLFLLFAVVASTPVHAAIIGSAVAIPDSEVLINFNGTGLDWVYAGPIAPNEFGPGQIELPSFRASEGWRFATVDEWAIKPIWSDFYRPGFAPVITNTPSHTAYRFTSEYWSDFTHVDIADAFDGALTNGFDIGSLNSVYDTWYVRNTAGSNTVPEPTTLLIFGSIGAMTFLKRRRGKNTSV